MKMIIHDIFNITEWAKKYFNYTYLWSEKLKCRMINLNFWSTMNAVFVNEQQFSSRSYLSSYSSRENFPYLLIIPFFLWPIYTKNLLDSIKGHSNSDSKLLTVFGMGRWIIGRAISLWKKSDKHWRQF